MLRHFLPLKLSVFFWVHDMFAKRQSDAKRFPVLEAHSQIARRLVEEPVKLKLEIMSLLRLALLPPLERFWEDQGAQGVMNGHEK